MSAKQALEIVAMRKAVDKRLDDTSHTCKLHPDPAYLASWTLVAVFLHMCRVNTA